MAYSITQFENNLTNSLQALDNNFITFGALAPIPCAIAGTNALTLTPNAIGVVPTPTLSTYANHMLFTGIANGTTTAATTAQVGSLPVLPVYKDTRGGPVLTAGGEISNLNAISLLYDSSLGGGTGGFHLFTSTAITNTDIAVSSIRIGNTQSSAITNVLSGTMALTFTATPGWSSQDQSFSVTAALASALPAVGDFIQVNPPSLGAAGVGYSGFITGVGSISSVASAATIAIRLLNAASASLASNSGIYRYLATRTVP